MGRMVSKGLEHWPVLFVLFFIGWPTFVSVGQEGGVVKVSLCDDKAGGGF